MNTVEVLQALLDVRTKVWEYNQRGYTDLKVRFPGGITGFTSEQQIDGVFDEIYDENIQLEFVISFSRDFTVVDDAHPPLLEKCPLYAVYGESPQAAADALVRAINEELVKATYTLYGDGAIQSFRVTSPTSGEEWVIFSSQEGVALSIEAEAEANFPSAYELLGDIPF